MAFSQEIRFKIGADTVELKKSMTSIAAVAQATGKTIDEVMKSSFAEARKLADFRDKQAYKEADTIGKMKILSAEMAQMSKDKRTFDEGSKEELNRQHAIEIKGAQLKQLSVKLKKEEAVEAAKALKLQEQQQKDKEKADKIVEKKKDEQIAWAKSISEAKSATYAKEQKDAEKVAFEERKQAALTSLAKIKESEKVEKQKAKEAAKAQSASSGATEGGELGSALAGGIFKRGLFMAVGTIVTDLLAAIPDYYSRKARVAQGQERATASQADILSGTIGEIGGFSAKAKLAREDFSIIATKIAMTKKDLETMTTNGIGKISNFISPTYKAEVDGLVGSLRELEVQQTQAGNAAGMYERQQRIAIGTLSAQLNLITEVNAKRKAGNLSDLEQAFAELALAKSLDRVQKDNFQSKEQALESRVLIAKATGNVDAAAKAQRLSIGASSAELISIQNLNRLREHGKLDSVEEAQAQLSLLKNLDAQQQAVGQTLDQMQQMPIAIAKAEGVLRQEIFANNKVRDSIAMQSNAVEQLSELRSTGQLNTITKAREELNLLNQLDAVEHRNGQNKLQAAASLLRIKQATEAVDAAIQNMQQRQLDVRQELTTDAAAGRTFVNGARRPRSETERLAQQAQAARTRLRNGVLTGASAEAEFQQSRARGIEDSVSARLAIGSSELKAPINGDLTQIATKIENSNALLGAIKGALVTQTVE